MMITTQIGQKKLLVTSTPAFDRDGNIELKRLNSVHMMCRTY
jgi:hypothetical protein